MHLKPAQLSIKHTAEHLDCSTPKVWQLVKTGELKVVGSKTKRWVTMASIEAFLAKLHAERQPRAECSRPAKASVQQPRA
jgi:hypothetical protein